MEKSLFIIIRRLETSNPAQFNAEEAASILEATIVRTVKEKLDDQSSDKTPDFKMYVTVPKCHTRFSISINAVAVKLVEVLSKCSQLRVNLQQPGQEIV